VVVALEDELEYLRERYGDLEDQVSRRPHWFKLSRGARRALPEAAEFNAVEQRLDMLSVTRESRFAEIATLASKNMADAIGKVAVASRYVDPDADPAAHALLISTIHEPKPFQGFGRDEPLSAI
jgi:hypothetical protein